MSILSEYFFDENLILTFFPMTHFISRRAFLGAGAAIPFAGTMLHATGTQTTSKVPPLIHCTDLFHPHGDPDDHFDLACVFSLAHQGLVDLKCIGMDYPPGFRAGDPGLIPVAQMNRICGLNVPTFIGSSQFAEQLTIHPSAPEYLNSAKPVSKKIDARPDLSRRDSIGIQSILEALDKSDRPVAITVVGSSMDVAIAARREPELFRKKCAGVYLNAGATHQTAPEKLEFNVNLNPAAYAAMFDLPCPLYWFPCWHMTEERKSGEWGTFYWMPHKTVFEGVSVPVRSYFWYMFSRSQDPRYIRMLKTPPPEEDWNKVLEGQRGMWSTASILMLAGLTVTRSGKIVPLGEAGDDAIFRMEHVQVECEDNGRLKWELSKEPTGRFVFHVLDVPNYPNAMTEAVRSLLLAFPEA